MSLVSFKEMLADAQKHHYTIGAFNVLNMETTQAVLAAADAKNVSVILQVYRDHLDFAGASTMVAIAGAEARLHKNPVCLSLDHGSSFEMAKLCVEAGFTGVMIDLSTSDYDQNVKDTRRVVELAHAKGVSVEAELGKIFPADMPVEVRNSGMTDPDEAASFVKDTGIDALAVSIGTAHGFYSSTPKIDFDRLAKIIEKCPCPIVVHGGSGTPDDDVKEMSRMGVAKLNVGTDLMAAFETGMQEKLKTGEFVDLMEVLKAGRQKEIEICMHKIDILTAYRK